MPRRSYFEASFIVLIAGSTYYNRINLWASLPVRPALSRFIFSIFSLTTMKKATLSLALGILLCLGANQVLAQVPQNFSYQGYLTDAAKSPITGIHHITVKIYGSPVEGSTLHSED